ncbi:hypothetical protein DY000_02022083 [Brassica cretica]|uniref:Uncharacterized protein n=1 Tax=Brassica cretica TaxID=69181 RepID=A0ABQ7EAA3_BRACR|nr:hypothetical protein DY000_02022083 [Brassica cretica]
MNKPIGVHFLGSGLQVPGPMFQVYGCSPYKEAQSNDFRKKQAQTTLLPLFLVMYPDILLKEGGKHGQLS